MSDFENLDVGFSGVTFDMDANRRSSRAPGCVLTLRFGGSRCTSWAASVSECAFPSKSEPAGGSGRLLYASPSTRTRALGANKAQRHLYRSHYPQVCQ
jgi:hypothetical protein